MKIGRRQFLAAGGIGAILAAGSGIAIVSASLEDGIIDSVRKSFPGLSMDESELRQFAQQLASIWNLPEPKECALANALDYPPVRQLANWYDRHRIRNSRGRVAAWFLRTTNYLDSARGNDPVRLVAKVDPYNPACSNMVALFADQTLRWPG